MVMSEAAKEFRVAHEADLIKDNPTQPQVLDQVLSYYDINIRKLKDIVDQNRFKMDKYITDFEGWVVTACPHLILILLWQLQPETPIPFLVLLSDLLVPGGKNGSTEKVMTQRWTTREPC